MTLHHQVFADVNDTPTQYTDAPIVVRVKISLSPYQRRLLEQFLKPSRKDFSSSALLTPRKRAPFSESVRLLQRLSGAQRRFF